MAAVQASATSFTPVKTSPSLVEATQPPTTILTPELVLGASILYMMSSDGEIDDKETSQLQAVIGSNEDLLNFSLEYVQKVSVETFLKQAPSVLSKEDKLCILTNVCDSMLSDGFCEPSELLFFETLLSAFGISTEEYKPYLQVIQLKNDKTAMGPFADFQDGSQITPHLALAVSLLYMMSADGRRAEEEIGQFETVVRQFEGLQKAALDYVRVTKREDFFKKMKRALDKRQQLCVLIHVCDSMMSDGVVAVVDFANAPSMVQFTKDTSASPNAQRLSNLNEPHTNQQAIGDRSDSIPSEELPREARIKNLFENIELLALRLDDFETKNKLLLDSVKKAKFAQDQYASKDQKNLKIDALDSNRQKLDQLTQSDKSSHTEAMALDRPIASSGLSKTHSQRNIQSVGAQVFGSNHQIIEQDASFSNWQKVAQPGSKKDLDLHRTTADSPSLLDPATKSTQPQHLALVTEKTLDHIFQVQQSKIEETALSSHDTSEHSTRMNPRQRQQTLDLVLYSKLVTTFCMLSLWSPSTNAVRIVSPRVVVGQLVRMNQMPIINEKLNSPLEIERLD